DVIGRGGLLGGRTTTAAAVTGDNDESGEQQQERHRRVEPLDVPGERGVRDDEVLGDTEEQAAGERERDDPQAAGDGSGGGHELDGDEDGRVERAEDRRPDDAGEG